MTICKACGREVRRSQICVCHHENPWAAENFEAKPASAATDIPSGTTERVRVYRQRMERGESLHHPQDNNSSEGLVGGPIRNEPIKRGKK